jgi:5-methylcytosine-specific restriction protein A
MPRKNPITKECIVCKNSFQTLDTRIKTCSKVCKYRNHSSWVKDNQAGENNPFYGKKHSKQTKERQSESKRKLVDSGWKPHNYTGIKRRYRKWERSWRKIRVEVLKRDNFLCRMPGCSKPAKEAHHIIRVVDGGETTKNNLVSLCRKCHHAVYKKEAQFEELFLGIIRNDNANGERLEVDNPVAQSEKKGARD